MGGGEVKLKKVEPSSPSSEELELGLELESDVKPVIFGPAFAFAFAFTFTRLEARCLDVRRVIRSSIEDTGEGDDNTGDSDRFLSFFGACFLAGCFAAGGRRVCFLLGGMV